MLRTRWAALAAVSLLMLVGCGDDDSTSADDAAGDTGDGGDSTGDDTDGGGDDGGDTVEDLVDDLDFGDGTARVTIGDTDYEFALGGNETADGTTFIGTCQELFGLLNGNGFVPGDPETTIEFDIPPPDWESYDDGRYDSSEPRIEIELGDDGGWAADLTLAENRPEMEGQSQLDDWTLDGSVAVGTATFIEMEPFSAPVEGATPVPGSFEIGCAEG
jgi:hypothetical protein